MSANTKIEWADHTFNPWIGCTKVGPGCDNCYAKTAWEDRKHRVVWGAGQPRSRTKTWGDPVKWNKQADAFQALHGRRQRVFCASLADVFDNEVPVEWRMDLFKLIADTPNLDWLILTKRIGNVMPMMRDALVKAASENGQSRWPRLAYWIGDWWDGRPPSNVWLGATIVNQEEADRDIPKLLAVPAAKRFLSMEPLLGPVDIAKYLDPWTCSNCGHWGSEADSGPCKCADCDVESIYDESIGSDRCPQCRKDNGTSNDVGPACPNCEQAGGWEHDYGFKFDSEKKLLDWVIVGGESGPSARPMHPDWARSLRDQCQAAGVPFLFKQWGEWHTKAFLMSDGTPVFRQFDSFQQWVNKAQTWVNGGICLDSDGCELRNGGDMARARDAGKFPVTIMHKVGKKTAGRLLDGITHDGVPS